MPLITTRREAARAALGSDIVMAGGWGFISNLLPIDLDDDRTPLPEGVEPVSYTHLTLPTNREV